MVATRSQIESRRKRREQAKTVAAGCDQLPGPAHGKEGVNGSSPEEALQKLRTRRCFRPKRARGSRLIDLFASERTSRDSLVEHYFLVFPELGATRTEARPHQYLV